MDDSFLRKKEEDDPQVDVGPDWKIGPAQWQTRPDGGSNIYSERASHTFKKGNVLGVNQYIRANYKLQSE